jgi:hypothetical protein
MQFLLLANVIHVVWSFTTFIDTFVNMKSPFFQKESSSPFFQKEIDEFHLIITEWSEILTDKCKNVLLQDNIQEYLLKSFYQEPQNELIHKMPVNIYLENIPYSLPETTKKIFLVRYIAILCNQNIPKIHILYNQNHDDEIKKEYTETAEIQQLWLTVLSYPSLLIDDYHVIESFFLYEDILRAFEKKTVNTASLLQLKRDLSKMIQQIQLPLSLLYRRREHAQQSIKNEEEYRFLQHDHLWELKKIQQQTDYEKQVWNITKEQQDLYSQIYQEQGEYNTQYFTMILKYTGEIFGNSGYYLFIMPLIIIVKSMLFSSFGILCFILIWLIPVFIVFGYPLKSKKP